VEEKTGRASNAYKEDFGAHLRGKRPVHNVLSEGVQADGGYLVPEEFERQIVMGLDEANVVRGLAKVITTSAERKIPVAATHSEAKWTAENGAYTESDPTFDQKTIDAFKLTDLVKVSIELLQDSAFDLESYIAAEFARAFGIAEEEAFCVGTGTGQPTGIFTANGGQVGVNAAGSTAVTADELISLVYALKSPYRRNAKFLTNDATIAAIRKLKDGNGVYLWQPSLQAGEPDKLLGYDLYTSPYVPQMEAGAYSVAFGDFKNYWIADRAGRTVQRLNELYSTNGQVGFVATERVDGKVILPEGIKLLKMKA
jgi:HK97 family phage major capsid protein